ncbi:hypothetical protein EVAR_335_1 [Eumeta japonica]|uniref:Ig-like domain-containing protein n=1 Tax=Eumeta variegata TaxID=151549 RepID=A0A4C1S9L6_EUMVA|nr:hypothetical protein EVAR_335_1 [Eumeta japonica]
MHGWRNRTPSQVGRSHRPINVAFARHKLSSVKSIRVNLVRNRLRGGAPSSCSLLRRDRDRIANWDRDRDHDQLRGRSTEKLKEIIPSQRGRSRERNLVHDKANRWYRETPGGTLREARDERWLRLPDALLLRRAEPQDGGRWACRAANEHGHLTLYMDVNVHAHLTVHASPQLQDHYSIIDMEIDPVLSFNSIAATPRRMSRSELNS